MTVVSDEFDPGYPLWTWTSAVSALAGSATITSASGQLSTTSGYSGTGWPTDPSAVSGTLHKDLADALVSSSGGDIVSADVSYYSDGDYTEGLLDTSVQQVPRVRIRMTLAAATSSLTLTFSGPGAAAMAAQTGVDGTTWTGAQVTLGGTSTQWDFVTDFHWGGMFSPRGYDRSAEYIDGISASRVWSAYDPQSYTTVERADRSRWLVIVRDMPERYISQRHAQDSILAAAANASASDTYGTLDRLRDADMSESAIHLVLNSSGSATYSVALDWQTDPGSDTYVSQSAIGRKFWNLRVPMVEQ